MQRPRRQPDLMHRVFRPERPAQPVDPRTVRRITRTADVDFRSIEQDVTAGEKLALVVERGGYRVGLRCRNPEKIPLRIKPVKQSGEAQHLPAAPDHPQFSSITRLPITTMPSRGKS